MKVSEIIEAIEKIAPLRLAAGWDHSGVQVAAFRQNAEKLAVLLDPTLAGLKAAVADGAECILCHHPLTMQPVYPNAAGEYLAVLQLLLARDIPLYSAHTSLDAAPIGPAAWLAGELQLAHVRVLEPTGEENGKPVGFGFVGDFENPVPYKEFCRILAQAIGLDVWQSCGPVPQKISRVACCPGSGAGLAGEALAAGADVLINGDVKYHAALDTKIRILDVGHFCLEEEMMRRFAAQLQAVLPVPVTFYPGGDPLALERVDPTKP